MQIQINTDHNIEGSEALSAHVRDVVASTLGRVSSHLTRVEVHLGDESGQKPGRDTKRCLMEARFENRKPVAVSSHAQSVHQAVEEAANKLIRAIDSDLGRLHDQASRSADSAQQPPLQEDLA